MSVTVVRCVDLTLSPEIPLVWYPATLKEPFEGLEVHMGLEFGIVLQGEIDRRTKDHRVRLRRGDTWFDNAYELHGWTTQRLPARLLSVTFLPWTFSPSGFLTKINWFAPFLVAPEHRPAVHPLKIRQKILSLSEEIFATQYSTDVISMQRTLLNLQRILLEILSAWQPPKQAVGADSEMERLIPAVDAILKGPPHRISQNEIAAKCGMSNSNFRKKFKRFMGISFSEYQMRARLTLASEKILEGQKLDAIASELGFTDASHLNRMFKRHFGVTPREYRLKGSSSPRLQGTQ